MAASLAAIAVQGFIVFRHHMFRTVLPDIVLTVFSFTTMVIGVPTGIKIFSWLATMWVGSIRYDTPMLFAVGFILMFLIGGIDGVYLGSLAVDDVLHGTYWVVSHIHYVLFGGSVMGVFAGIYYWFPKITGRMLSEGLGKLSFWLMFIGVLATFLIQHVIGLDGMPRRVYEYDNVGNLGLYNLISTIGAFILAAGVLATVLNVVRSLKLGPLAGPDPWKANTLEWLTPSPPPVNNFDVIPRVPPVAPVRDIRRQVERSTGVTQKTGGSERFARV